MSQNRNKGKVYFVGAGPGDPELITLKAARIIFEAEVILHDRLVSSDTLKLASSTAQIVLTGKQYGGNSISQKDINLLIKNFALEGKMVVRLKGGDAAFFSNILDELETVTAHKIDFEIIPGITAASGASAYAGIPLTARGYADSVRFLSLHDFENAENFVFRKNETLVLYMSSSKWENVFDKLVEWGINPILPVAFISQATTINQQSFFSTINNASKDFEGLSFVSPTLIIIGEVVSLSEKFRWFSENKIGNYFTAL